MSCYSSLAASHPSALLSAKEYLDLERVAEIKSEYIDGDVVAMPGASREHNLIVVNLVAELRQQLKGRPEVVYPSDLRVWIPATRRYTYPDVIVVAEESLFQDEQADTLLNPAVILEVLSPGTESYDRGEKFAAYRSIESVQEYFLVSQVDVRVERYVRQADGRWMFSEHADPAEGVRLSTIDCVLQMAEIYDKIPGRGLDRTVRQIDSVCEPNQA